MVVATHKASIVKRALSPHLTCTGIPTTKRHGSPTHSQTLISQTIPIKHFYVLFWRTLLKKENKKKNLTKVFYSLSLSHSHSNALFPWYG
jgi:hypothetical protein